MKNKHLLIGPRSNIQSPNVTGGIIVLFEDLLAYCDRNNVDYMVIDTNKSNYKNKIFAFIHILSSIVAKTPRSTHVSLHGTAKDYLYIAPFALGVSKIFGKFFSLRKFAGNYIELYENYSPLQKKIISQVLHKSSYNFFETKYLVKYFKKLNKNTFWFPNVRKKSDVCTRKDFKKRFIYLGAIKAEKGIDVLCEASNLLSEDYRIDLYGTLYDEYEDSYFDNYNLTYKGKLNPEYVINTLLKYDVLVLPSLREGYPGVIIEALSIGLPIIATNLEGIKEMINEQSSVLIDPLNVLQLKEAIESFNIVNHKKKSMYAMEQFENFNSEIQTKAFFKRIKVHA